MKFPTTIRKNPPSVPNNRPPAHTISHPAQNNPPPQNNQPLLHNNQPLAQNDQNLAQNNLPLAQHDDIPSENRRAPHTANELASEVQLGNEATSAPALPQLDDEEATHPDADGTEASVNSIGVSEKGSEISSTSESPSNNEVTPARQCKKGKQRSIQTANGAYVDEDSSAERAQNVKKQKRKHAARTNQVTTFPFEEIVQKLRVTDSAGTRITFRLYGMFNVHGQIWYSTSRDRGCYIVFQRNRMNVIGCSYVLQGPSHAMPARLFLHQVRPQPRMIKEFRLRIDAHDIDEADVVGDEIGLEQFRDSKRKSETKLSKVESVATKPRPGSTPESRSLHDKFEPSLGGDETTCDFERVAFKGATKHNGNRRAEQSFGCLCLKLMAVLEDDTEHVVAIARSRRLIVMARSPSGVAKVNFFRIGSNLRPVNADMEQSFREAENGVPLQQRTATTRDADEDSVKSEERSRKRTKTSSRAEADTWVGSSNTVHPANASTSTRPAPQPDIGGVNQMVTAGAPAEAGLDLFCNSLSTLGAEAAFQTAFTGQSPIPFVWDQHTSWIPAEFWDDIDSHLFDYLEMDAGVDMPALALPQPGLLQDPVDLQDGAFYPDWAFDVWNDVDNPPQ